MASRLFQPSRIIAVALIIAAAAWIFSGSFASDEAPEAASAGDSPAVPVQKVGVSDATPETRARSIVLSCVTEADRRAMAVARGDGVIVDLVVSRGSAVRSGEPIATISDEGRESAVGQAEALLAQRKAEYDANKRLIDQGTLPRNSLPGLEASYAAAEAALAAARAELEKNTITSPIDGIVDTVPVQVGQAVQVGAPIAEVIDPDPMLAVGAVSESRRGSLRVGQNATIRFVGGEESVDGTINFVGLSAEAATRTYPVEARMMNPDTAIADGVTCEMTVSLEPIEATSIPRSALVFSDDGRLGVRIADAASKALFVPVEIVEDSRASIWVTGLAEATRLIVVGQDFVKDGDPVEAVPAAAEALESMPAAEAEAADKPPA
jgi:multidrug efflux system membrane fusion protein